MVMMAFHCAEAVYSPTSPTDEYFVSSRMASQLHRLNELSCKAIGKEKRTSSRRLFTADCGPKVRSTRRMETALAKTLTTWDSNNEVRAPARPNQ